MKMGRFARKLSVILAASTFLLATEGAAWAQHGGGHVGAAGAGVHGGVAVGGPRGGAIGRGGSGFTGPGVRGGPGLHGYGYGWRRAPGWGWWWGGWGWPLGVYLSVLPGYYSTFWWDGIPYYYADGDYYVWNGIVGQYEQVQPPSEVAQEAPGAQPAEAPPASDDELFAYPQNGQSPEQQAKDKSECRAWATGQVAGMSAVPNSAPGPAPGSAPGNPGAAETPPASAPATVAQRQGYLRAEAACLEARGYSVE